MAIIRRVGALEETIEAWDARRRRIMKRDSPAVRQFHCGNGLT